MTAVRDATDSPARITTDTVGRRRRVGEPAAAVVGRSRDPARDLLRSTMREHRADLRGLAAWSLLEAVPAVVSGLAVAKAVDDGFLGGRP